MTLTYTLNGPVPPSPTDIPYSDDDKLDCDAGEDNVTYQSSTTQPIPTKQQKEHKFIDFKNRSKKL